MLSSDETTCLIRLSVRAFSSDRGLQAKRAIWKDIVLIYAENFPESVSLMDMAWCLLNSGSVLWRAAEPTLASMSLSYEATM